MAVPKKKVSLRRLQVTVGWVRILYGLKTTASCMDNYSHSVVEANIIFYKLTMSAKIEP